MSVKNIQKLFAGFICFVVAGASVHAVEAQQNEMEKWADGAVGSLVKAGRVTGAVVSVVKDGRIVLEKGYGQGNVLTGEAADPAVTRSRIGSTTKTFTATIIAQLMQEGKIQSLDDPANKYLKRYQLPDNGGVAITLKHLLTHTAGFEDRFFFIGSDRPVSIPVDAELYDTLRPDFTRPVGEKVVYSNFGVATLGLVIEDITRQPINDVMEARIFEPLGMSETELVVTIQEPEGLAVPGIVSAGGMTGPVPFTAINPAVAQTGSIVATAHDMALYMNAHMEGWPEHGQQLQEKLFVRLAANHPDIGGLGMVFFVDKWAGKKVVSHGGNWAGFHTWMTMVPEEHLGFYVTLFSEAEPHGVVDRFLSTVVPSLGPKPSPALLSASSLHSNFLQQFLGDKRPILPAIEIPVEAYAGTYQADRRPYHSVEALSSLVYFGAGILDVTVGEGGLYLNGGGPFVPVGEGRFMLDAPGRPMMVFAENSRTGVMTISHDLGIYTFTKIPVIASSKVHAIILHIVILLSVFGLAAPFLLGAGKDIMPAIMIGAASLLMVLTATVGLSEGGSLITPFYAGHVGRIGLFILAYHVLIIGALWSFWRALKADTVKARVVLGLFMVMAAISALLLLPYNVLGWQMA
ncbi:serine hydrolase domain-containing protein [Kordiimonas sp.]|uniref:serine hydrolase domain-containing protein n=1 Tax=Kordiimonas sp. TaxID=1970157 RepID=UPI003A93C12E